MCGNIFWLLQLSEMLLPSGERPGMQLNIPQYIGQLPATIIWLGLRNSDLE